MVPAGDAKGGSAAGVPSASDEVDMRGGPRLVDGSSHVSLRLHVAAPCVPLSERPSSGGDASRRDNGPPTAGNVLLTNYSAKTLFQKGYFPKFQEGLCPVRFRGVLSTTLEGRMGQGRSWGPLEVSKPHEELWSHNDLRGRPS